VCVSLIHIIIANVNISQFRKQKIFRVSVPALVLCCQVVFLTSADIAEKVVVLENVFKKAVVRIVVVKLRGLGYVTCAVVSNGYHMGGTPGSRTRIFVGAVDPGQVTILHPPRQWISWMREVTEKIKPQETKRKTFIMRASSVCVTMVWLFF
jgi:site-specific DNA-cytosine methylase